MSDKTNETVSVTVKPYEELERQKHIKREEKSFCKGLIINPF